VGSVRTTAGGASPGAAPRVAAWRRFAWVRIERWQQTFRSRKARVEALWGVAFALPWLIGFFLFTAFPIAFSLVLSFCEWDPYERLHTRTFVGLDNYVEAFTSDPLMWKSLWNTCVYAVAVVPLGLALSLILALLLNQPMRGVRLFRALFYIPSVISGVATVFLWWYIFDPVFGPLNGAIRHINRALAGSGVLAFLQLPEPGWLVDPLWAKPALIIMALWASGGAAMLIFLAGLQGIPRQLYEAAELDGAGRWRRLWNVTLPMLSPSIFFNLIIAIIATLQVFMQSYVLDGGLGGTDNSLLFYVLHMYKKAFEQLRFGYASALAWILFTLIMALTLLIIRSSAVWVYYEGERRG
jgi:multiple sugar transport system permease protein